jgi:drug/metabolite transporter (DMT)-like permease
VGRVLAGEREAGAKGIGLAAAAAATFSTAPVVIRFAFDLSPLEVTCYRLLLGGLAVGALARHVGQPIHLGPAELARLLPIGAVTAVHFLGFIAAFKYTTIAHALTITYLAPTLTAVLAWKVLGEPMPLRRWGGVALTLVGVGVLTGFEPEVTPRMLAGDAMALISALAYGIYSILGRRERDRLPLFTYAAWIYFLAGLIVLPFALAAGTHRFTPVAAAATVYLGLVPMAGGHTLYNAALRRMHPAVVNVIASQEVTGGILLAWLILGEIPAPHVIAGAGLTLLGVALVVRQPPSQKH